jgi:hypothetical protein
MMALLTFTGHPFIDLGSAVLSMICNKECYAEVTKEDILNNLDEFLEVIKHRFNDLNASEKELEYSKRGLKQHFALMYNINHYLFGINNKIENPISGKKETVKTGEEFVETFKQTVVDILENKNSLCENAERKSTDNICRFCGKPSDLILSKDIMPFGAALNQKNLGQVHSCNGCYLSILFSFVPMFNVRVSEATKGVYMFYYFSDEKYMIEYAREQYQFLKREMLASLQTLHGNWYEVLVDHLREIYANFRMRFRVIEPHFITVYFFLNDNREASLSYINVPDGMCKFINYISTADQKWNRMKKNFRNSEEYERFIQGDFLCMNIDGSPKFGFEDINDVKFYMREVSLLEDQFINAAENIGNGLLKYYRNLKPSKWVEEYEKKMNVEKPYVFINSLLDLNEEYFKVQGENIFDISDVKQIMSENRSALAFRLIKYFIYNNMTEEEKQQYVEFNRLKKNMVQEEEV